MSKRPIKRYQCLVCCRMVLDLARHLRQAHDYSREQSVKPKQTGGFYKCPLPGCKAVVRRVDRHLNNVYREVEPERQPETSVTDTEKKNLLTACAEYLMSTNRCKDDQVATQHWNQVERIWSATTTETDLNSFFNAEAIERC